MDLLLQNKGKSSDDIGMVLVHVLVCSYYLRMVNFKGKNEKESQSIFNKQAAKGGLCSTVDVF